MRLILNEPKRYEVWRKPWCVRRRRPSAKQPKPRLAQFSHADAAVFDSLRRALDAERDRGELWEIALSVKTRAAADLGISVGELQAWLDSRTDAELQAGILAPGR